MSAVEPCTLPDGALLTRYRESGDYTDCFSTRIDRPVSLAEFIHAFYTTPLFRCERLILKWLVSKPSTDDDVAALASGAAGSFAAWTVEARADDQILLCDFQGNTRSWLMVRPVDESTDLFFGSAVTAATDQEDGSRKLERRFSILLWFHRAYSVALLKAARKRLLRT
ncbi:MAG: hypothetical protein R3212_10555 [Xanthomonadales bacterium]|nr:hypothetical protein [Xanthomonadales bacterium]